MEPRFLGELRVADAVTVSNAALGFVAAVVATVDVGLAARLVLLAAIADGLDGVLARRYGSSAAGPYLDSLADVASFGVAPAVVVHVVARDAWNISWWPPTVETVAAIGVPALFVAMAVVRLGLYTALDTKNSHTEGVQSTLAATILAAAVLARVLNPLLLVVATLVFAYLMVTTINYPDLHARDALIMGVVQTGAILAPTALNRSFPWALLIVAVAYLVFGPRFYWRKDDGSAPDASPQTDGDGRAA